MQTTLLSLAVALILALVAALVGPYVVDWTRYRTEIEAEASRIIGAPVTVSGPIEVRLLPTPSLSLRSVIVSGGKTEFSARSLRLELALGPLMRGEWQVSELTLGEPKFRLGSTATAHRCRCHSRRGLKPIGCPLIESPLSMAAWC